MPLATDTKHLIDAEQIGVMKKGVMLINTSRGGLVDTKAVIDGLKTGKVGYFGMDVYEEEEGLFFEDHSDEILQDDVIARLMTFNNVLITSHQAFLTSFPQLFLLEDSPGGGAPLVHSLFAQVRATPRDSSAGSGVLHISSYYLKGRRLRTHDVQRA